MAAAVSVEATAKYEVTLKLSSPNGAWKALVADVNGGLATPDLRARVADLGGTPAINTPAAFKSLLVRETDKWAKVVKFANIKAA